MCDRCQKSVSAKEIKIVPRIIQSTEAICAGCRGEKVFHNTHPDETPVRMLYVCDKCNFKFRHNPNSVARRICPWCGDTEHSSLA